ncbi:MAG: PAS domain-containing protein, partial [Deltaproteobacteria bacterium]|nr:PAS domain-containing protein [Deltaproteobacteria bacterium]
MTWTFSRILVSDDGPSTPKPLQTVLADSGLVYFEVTVTGALNGGQVDLLNGQELHLTIEHGRDLLVLLGEDEQSVTSEPLGFFDEHIHPSDQDRLTIILLSFLSGNNESISFDHLLWDSAAGQWRKAVLVVSMVGRTNEMLRLACLIRLADISLKGDGQVSVLGSSAALDPSNLGETEHYRLMLDSMPMACSLWDSRLNQIDCNFAVIPIFGVPDKASYLEYFPRLSPPYQPDGRASEEVFPKYLLEALEEEQVSFEWLFQTIDGDPIQSDVHLVKVSGAS